MTTTTTAQMTSSLSPLTVERRRSSTSRHFFSLSRLRSRLKRLSTLAVALITISLATVAVTLHLRQVGTGTARGRETVLREQDAHRSQVHRVRILCWILTDPSLLSATEPIRDTWTRRCDVALFMSSQTNSTFPTVGLNVSSGRDNIAEKSREAWKYIYRHHRDDADFFVKADPDSYVMIDNLRHYLSQCNASEPNIYGHALRYPGPVDAPFVTHFVAGQAVVLTSESLRRLVDVAMKLKPPCFSLAGQGEDLKTCICLYKVGGHVIDTRDQHGRETFLPPICVQYVMRSQLDRPSINWYKKDYRKPFGICEGSNKCFSDRPVAFHCVKADTIYLLDYMERIISSRSRDVVASNHDVMTTHHDVEAMHRGVRTSNQNINISGDDVTKLYRDVLDGVHKSDWDLLAFNGTKFYN